MLDMKKILFLIILAMSNIVIADEDKESKVDFASKLESEYGTCYKKFQENLGACNPFICSFPDLNDAKAWKAQSIRGTYGDKCYVLYYRYLNDKVIGEPLHCYYTRDIVENLVLYYHQLFLADKLDKELEIKGKINTTAMDPKYCRTRSSALNDSGSNN